MTRRIGQHRRRSLLICIAAALCLVGSLLSSGAAAASTPAWDVSATAAPTRFVPGTASASPGILHLPLYSLLVTNVGGGAATGGFTVQMKLASGITPLAPSRVTRSQGLFEDHCQASGQVATCEFPEPLIPGDYVQVLIPLEVSATAAPVLQSQVMITGGGASPFVDLVETEASSTPPAFDFLPGARGLSASITEPSGQFLSRAGSHPQQTTIDLQLPTREVDGNNGEIISSLVAIKHVRDLGASLPRGMVANPQATAVKCTEAELESVKGCPPASQVGLVNLITPVATVNPWPAALYNMVPPPGAAANFGFEALEVGIYIHLLGGVRPDGSYELAASGKDILARPLNPIIGVQVQLWGNPADPSHDEIRGKCLNTFEPCSKPGSATNVPFLTTPTSCGEGMTVFGEADSWESPEETLYKTGPVQDNSGNQLENVGCDQLNFSPSISLRPEVDTAETPSGLDVDLHLPQQTGVKSLAEAHLKGARVALPAGVAVNPSAANGLDSCSPGQFAEKQTSAGACPDSSKVGSVEVSTPLLDHPLPGAVYVATPRSNRFGSLLALFLEVNDPRSGVVIKLAGQVEADPSDGRLTATFDENPQLPFEDLRLQFFGGPRAALRTPPACGLFTSQAQLEPWSGTGATDVADTFTINGGAASHPCVENEGQLPHTFDFDAGTKDPLAGEYSPLVLNLRRGDGTQQLKQLDLSLPPGLSGKLASLAECPTSSIEAAEKRAGQAEIAAPSCPAGSFVGNVEVGVGAGAKPYFVDGRAYLTGPYKGAPLGLAIITPAVAGPFDLGTVVVRSALFIDPASAQITVKSDPLPTILEGIPLDVRDIRVEIGRPNFTLNPTSCNEMRMTARATSPTGAETALGERFQVGGCAGLGFKPSLQLQLKGATHRRSHPKLIAVLKPRTGDANVAYARVKLPHAAFLDNSHIRNICTRPAFATETCPASSLIGRATAKTPLLDYSLPGKVYLKANPAHKLPDLAVSFKGPESQPVRFTLEGKIDSVHGALRSTFESAPDVPVSRFQLELFGGRKGLVILSSGLCARPRAQVVLRGHNGKELAASSKIKTSCGKAGKKKRR